MSGGARTPPVTYDGEYDPDKTYLPLRIVKHDGGVYLSVATSTGVDPDPLVETPWLLLNRAGGGTVINVLAVLDTLITSPTGAFIDGRWFDRNRDYNNWANANSGTQELVIDLGREVVMDKIRWVLFWGDTRTYANVAVYASHDGSTWTTLRSPATYQPSLDGIDGLVLTSPGTWRYLKFHSEGNSVNSNNEWVEFGVYASL